jgi:L-lactate dehydrogenase complex protein LldG
MHSKDDIINRIKKISFPAVPLPDITLDGNTGTDIEILSENLGKMGGRLVIAPANLQAYVAKNFPAAMHVFSAFPEITSTVKVDKTMQAGDLSQIELAILKGDFIVEENGAVWLSENEMHHRILFSIAEHLILVVDKKNVVKNMQVAYRSKALHLNGYGVFIAGPSKTADIEQTLVIGAHGAKSLTVILS